MQRAKQSLSYGLVRRNYPSLVYATENHFSGSGNACLLRVSTLIRFTSALNGADKNLVVSDEAHGTVPRSPLPALLTAI